MALDRLIPCRDLVEDRNIAMSMPSELPDDEITKLRYVIGELLAAANAVIGYGYYQTKDTGPQDYVHKDAIKKVRDAIAKAQELQV